MYDFTGLKVLADISRQQAKLRGNAVALHFQGRDTTYAALDKRTSQIANGLIAQIMNSEVQGGWPRSRRSS